MRVVNFLHEIGDRELQLMQPEPARLVARRKLQARPETEQNIGDLRDHQLSRLEKWRREWRTLVARAVHHRHHLVHAARLARDIVIGCAGIFQREPDEFAAALNFRPIEQLIAHGTTPAADMRFQGASFTPPWRAPWNDCKGYRRSLAS